MKGRASAPGSSGNLGPGFDVLALAVELRCTVTAEPASSWLIEQDGDTYEPDPDDLVRVAAAAMTDGAFRLEIENVIPRSKGLGSSAAVAVAAAAAAIRSRGGEPRARDLFESVAEIEGHPDNAAASVYGGLVAAGQGVVRHLDVHPDLRVVVGIPPSSLPTPEARAALPAAVGLDVAARSLARVVFLVDGLHTADAETLAAARGDELHEVHRDGLSPVTAQLMAAATRAGALHAAWSGAGPAAIALALDPVCDAVQGAMIDVLDGQGDVRCLDRAEIGWT